MSEVDKQPDLTGQTIRLRPLTAEDLDGLYRAASDPKIWESHPDSERYKKEVFVPRFFEGALTSKGALIIEEIETGEVVGSSRYYEWDPQSREIAIGYTFITRRHWGAVTNRELKALMLEHIYQWATVVWFHVGEDNIRSRRAVEKLGATLDYKEARELDGKPFNQLYYRLPESQYRAQQAKSAGTP